jgi:methionine sulfoxide reductase heme-binding subunit
LVTPKQTIFVVRQATLALLLWPAADLAWNAWIDQLGPKPVTQAIHWTGDWTVVLLLTTLALTPARALFGWQPLVSIRRRVGVATALYAVLHLTLYAFDQNWNLIFVASEIVKRIYLTIGFVALLLLATLAITSTDGWQRKLKKNWQRLHRAIFVILALALVHFLMQSKLNITDATLAAGLAAWLMMWRLLPRQRRNNLLALSLITVLAPLITMGVEAAWYGLVNHVNAERVFNANFNPALAPRPALNVLLAGVAVLVLAAARQLFILWRNRRATMLAAE